MKDIIKQAIVDMDFYNSMPKFSKERGLLMTFENLELSKTDVIELKKTHKLSEVDEILILFSREYFQEGDLWTADRTFYYTTLFLENRISFYKEEYKHGSGKENEWSSEIYYTDIESVEVYDEHIRFFILKST